MYKTKVFLLKVDNLTNNDYYNNVQRVVGQLIKESFMIAKLESIIEAAETAKVEVAKLLEKGVKASAPKIRKEMQTVKNLAQDIRVEAQNTVNALKEAKS